VQDLSFGNLDRLETGGLITRLTNDVTQLTDTVAMLLRIMVRVPLLLVGSMIMAVFTSPRLALLFLVLIPTVALVIGLVMRIAFPIFKVVQKKLDRLNTVMQENLAGVRVVRVFARAGYERDRFETANTDLKETTLSVIKYIVIVMPVLMFVINVGIVATLWFGGRMIDTGSLEVGQLVAFSNYLLQSLMSIMFLSMLAMRFARAEASASRVNEVLDSVPTVTNPPVAIEAFRPRGRVEFDNVTFAYDDDSEPVLREISFTAEPGQTVAILGATGSGKSSLISLIPRFYDPTEGRVLIDGIDVREIDERVLRSTIAVALQESVLFTGSIRDNIRYGRPAASDAEVERAARMAQAWEFISELPGGLDSIVGQRGVNLSGGQKQRIAIARALMLQAPILILDDSTSAVDVATEARIQAAMADLRQTCFIVAQRISAVVAADKILVLDAGRIVAEGTHGELMDTSTVYRDIYESQVEGAGVFHGAA
ncbi:MAG: ABC transporter ATP-binding protein/permease, partial [Chloroflexota bacterium]|nr:ABC transporter ATP-binding protein/permease [Chloroflexota bacterium]